MIRAKTLFSQFTKNYVALVATIIMSIVFSFVSDYFFTATNIRNIFLQTAAVGNVTIGQAYVLLSGQIDLSLGQNLFLTSVVMASLMKVGGLNPWLAILIGLIFGALIGLVNGILSAYIGIPALIATLGMQMVCRGVGKIVTGAASISRLPEEILFIGQGNIGFVPVSVIIMLALFIFMHFISQKTRFGREVYATGGGAEAAFFSGINIKRHYCKVFTLAGLLAAISGVILMARLDSVSVTSGTNYEFDAAIACVIGGISLTGGRGKIINAFFGAIFLVLFFNGMTLLNVDTFYQDVIKGVVLIVAIAMDIFRNKVRN